MSKLFNLFAWITKSLEGSHLGSIPLTYLAHELIYTRLAPKGKEVLTNSNSHKIYVNSRDKGEVASALLSGERYSPFLTDVIERNCPEGSVCIDVGAHVGYYTLTMARQVGSKGKVYSFEPASSNYNLLLKNISANEYTNVVPSNKAVSSKVGVSKLLINRVDLEGNYLLSRKSPSSLGFKTLEVQTTTLDSLLINKINLVKIDVEGAELAVLKGMDTLIKENKHIVLVLEFLPYMLKRHGTTPELFLNSITNLGLSIYNIDEIKEELYLTTPEFLLSNYKGTSCTNLLLRKES